MTYSDCGLKFEDTNYDDLRINFLMEYDRANPVTSYQATVNWIEFLVSKQPGLAEKLNKIKDNMSTGGHKFSIEQLFKVDNILTNTNKTLINYSENTDTMYSFKNNTSSDNLYYLYNKDDSGTVINIEDGYYYLVLDIHADGDSKRLNRQLEIRS